MIIIRQRTFSDWGNAKHIKEAGHKEVRHAGHMDGADEKGRFVVPIFEDREGNAYKGDKLYEKEYSDTKKRVGDLSC